MDDNICEVCGTRNEPGAQFCVQCQSFLPWYDTHETDLKSQGIDLAAGPPSSAPSADSPIDPGPAGPSGAPVATLRPDPQGEDPAAAPRARVTNPDPAPPVVAAPARPQRPPAQADPVRVVIEPTEIEVVPGGDEVSVEVLVYNLSPIVDAFQVSAPHPPEWLTVSTTEVRLLPNSNERTALRMKIAGRTLAPAGRLPLLVRVQSVAHPELIVDEQLELTVPGVRTPLVLRLEPSIVRAKDAEAGRFQATVDNSDSNEARQVTLSGRDPEGLVRFHFSPRVLDVPAGGTASAGVRVEAQPPEPGQQATRQLTVTASEGEADVDATATFVQTTSVEVPMTMRVEPSVVKVKDSATGQLDIVIDNRKGTRTRRVFLGGSDPERAVHFAFSPPSIDVLPGELGRARLRIEAPPPPAGQEASRSLTVLASSEGMPDLEVAATFVQSTSAATPLAVRLDPSVVRVRDTKVGQLEAIIDNRGGNRVRRVFLSGRDPERLVRFTFSPPSLDVLPGDVGRVRVRLEAPLPDPGQEATRQVTVVGTDGPREIEAGGTFVQVTSVAPVETPVALKLEPSLVRVRDNPSAQIQVIIDNRQGIRPRRVTLAGSDPERAVAFSFWPPVVEVGTGQIARANARLDAWPPEPGKEVTRQFSVSASDGAKEVESAGTLIQSTSPPPPDEPMTLRLDPSIVRVRNRGGGNATVTVDNRGGSRPRRVQLIGTDPERVVRFSFSPPVLDLAPGQAAAVAMHLSAPRPDGGEQLTRPFSVVGSDGQRDTEVSGSFVQESSDRRPMWRILLTLLGGLMMMAGALLAWNTTPKLTGLNWDLPELDAVSENIRPGQLFPDLPDNIDPIASVGAVVILLGVLAIFGLTGSTGRLTRLSALVCAVGLAAFLIAVRTQVDTGPPGPGAFLVLAGCAVAFVGGLFAKPRK